MEQLKFNGTDNNNPSTAEIEPDINNIYDDVYRLILSKPIYDEAEAFKFELLYIPNDKYVLATVNTSTNEENITNIPIMEKPSKIYAVMEKQANGKKLENTELLINSFISIFETELISKVSNGLAYIDNNLKDEVSHINHDLFKSICLCSTYDEADHLDKPESYKIKESIEIGTEFVRNNNKSDVEKIITSNFTSRKDLAKTRQLLGNYLNKNKGIILRNDINTPFIIDENLIGYNKISFDGILTMLNKEIGNNIVSDKDLETALSFIGERPKPEYNKVKFNNCIYNMEKMQVIEPEKPIFTLAETGYNYNPNAESTHLKRFLETSLDKGTPEKTQYYIKGVLQLVGYLFTSGNYRQTLTFIVGIGGGGKSVFTNILTDIFGVDKVSDLKLQSIGSEHGTSSLIDKHLNIVRDSDDRLVEDEDIIKQLSGNDPIQVNPKFKDAITIPKEEVPKTLIVANAIPKFRKLSESLLSRIVIVEFNIKFRGTPKEDNHLEAKILNNPQEIEWLIYNGLKAYNEMLQNNENFILQLDENKTKELVEKYSKPVNYLVSKLILKYDPEAAETETGNEIFIDELNKLCVILAKSEGIEIKTDKHGLINGRTLFNAVKEEFNLFETIDNDGNKYTSKILRTTRGAKRYYPDLIKNNEIWDNVSSIEFIE